MDCFQSNIKVSIIVPIYNAGNRIHKCLDTLVNQTLREIEIICVLDFPTDGTDKVVEEYASKDDRIVVIRNDHNMHISGSRNEGLKVARGEYIGFSDHDDYRELDMYGSLYTIACEKKSDIVLSNVHIINEDGSEEVAEFKNPSRDGILTSLLLPDDDKRNENKICRAVWHSLFKNSFVVENNLCFESRKVYLEEDTLFNLKAFLLARNCDFCNRVFYTWDKHCESESNKILSHEEICVRSLHQMSYVYGLLEGSGVFQNYKEQFYKRFSLYINIYYRQYSNLGGDSNISFVKLVHDCNFPLLGRYNLNLISRKRLKLFFFIAKVKLNGVRG